jgi:outer membrane autotransporter protein
MSASFSSDVWSVYGEGGVPLDLGVGFTPYFGLRYLDSSSGAFAETSSNSTPGIAAAALNVSNASAKSFVSYLGAEFSTQLATGGSQDLLPSLRLAWAHNFSDPWKVDAAFSGVPGSGFEIDGSTWSRDSGILDAGLSMLFMDNLLGTIGYDASLNSTQTVQSAYGRVDFKF